MTPLTPEHLAAIRYRAEHHWPASAADVPVLLAALAAMEQDRDRLREQAQRLNRPMVARLHRCAADTSSNWDGQITIYPPEARELTALIDAFDMSAEVKRGYDETLAKLTAELAQASTADAETPEDTEAIYDEAAAKLRKARAQRDQARAAGFADAVAMLRGSS